MFCIMHSCVCMMSFLCHVFLDLVHMYIVQCILMFFPSMSISLSVISESMQNTTELVMKASGLKRSLSLCLLYC